MRVNTPRVMAAEEASALVGQAVAPLDPTVTHATIGVDPDAGPVFAYLPMRDRDAVAELRRAALTVDFSAPGVYRSGSGTRTMSRTFGMAPRKVIQRREGCSMASLAFEQPAVHTVLESWAARMETVIREIDPEIVTRDEATLAEIQPDWRIGPSGLWTSGVVNRTSQLPYHRDRFNFPTWSAMPVLRRHVTGGYLHIPEYGAVIPCRDGWAVYFCGFQLVHGVTPMELRRTDGYRLSIVYYALRGAKDCFTAAAEATHAARSRTEREVKIAARIRSGERMPR